MPDTTCPVCGMAFPEEEAESLGAFKATHGGKSYWLDSSTCRDAFAKNPPKFVAKQ